MQEVDQTGQGVWLGPVRGGGERGTGTVAAGTAVAGWPGHSNLRRVRPLRTRGKDLRQMRCQRRPRPEVSSVRVASPSPAKPQSPQTALRRRRGSGTRVLSPAAALQSPDPGGERVNPGGARSGPIFRGMHSLPPTNPLREPSPLPSPALPYSPPAQQRGPEGAAQQGRESSQKCRLKKRSVRGLRTRRKLGVGARSGEREFSRRGFPFETTFQQDASRPCPPLQFGARQPAQRPPAQRPPARPPPPAPPRPSPGFPSPGPGGPWRTLPAQPPPLGASPSASRKLREAKPLESPRERSRRSAPPAWETPPTAPRETLNCAKLSTYVPGRLLPARSAALAARFGPGGPRLARAVGLRTGCPSFFLAPARFPRAWRSLSSRWSWRSAPAVQHCASDPARCAPPAPRSTPPWGP